MTAGRTAAWLPITGAFIVWFAHFMVCWAAAELIWPRQWVANAVAWGATAVALLALGVVWVRLGGSAAPGAPPGDTAGWARRIGRGATALAGVAVVFSVLPSLVFLP